MNTIYRSILILLSLIALFVWYTKRKKTRSIKSNILVVGTNAEFPPFSFMKDNKIVGFDIDVIKHIAEQLSKTVLIKEMPFEALIPALQLGDIQVIAAGISSTPIREKRIFFTKPHLANNPLIIVSLANKPPIRNIKDLKGKAVVVNEGYVADSYISSLEGPVIIRLSSPSIADGILTLKSGRAHAFVVSQQSIKPFFKKYSKNKEFNSISIPETDESYSFAISKKNPALFKQIQNIVDEMQQDGTLEQLKQIWNLDD